MSNARKTPMLSEEIRAKARLFEADVAVAQARRYRRAIAALCVAVVAFGGVTGGLLARVPALWATAQQAEANDGRLRPGDLQVAQSLEAGVAVSDAGTVGTVAGTARLASAGTGDVALAGIYEEPLVRAPETDPGQLEDAPTGRVRQASFPALESLGRGAPGSPVWQRHAVNVGNVGNRPMIAIVIDDLGLNRGRAHKTIALPAPLTLAFMTYAEGLPAMASAARSAGHELMLHVPMQPRSHNYDPGPNALDANLPADEVVRRLRWGLERFDGFVGINNHMGSRFTTSPDGMARVMRELRARGLLFLDSLTAAASVGAQTAQQAGVPYAVRDVFLDNNPNDANAIRAQLAKLEAVATRRGYAVGIGHPHKETIRVLAEWLPEARRRGIALVPISTIVRHRIGIAQAANKPAG